MAPLPHINSTNAHTNFSHQAESPSISSDGRTTLQYDELPQDRYIRVLDLAPGSWDAPVVCSLRTVHLDDDHLRYEAISYAWGDPTDRKTIVCNGVVVSTTRSLFEALQRFRYVSTTRTLWADALCINQADNDERTSQVRLMSFIYKRADRVLVWLQHDDDEVVQDGLNAICQYVCKEDGFARYGTHNHRTQHLSTEFHYRWRDVEVTSVSIEGIPEVALVASDALRYICSSRWFGRGWVIQEVVLGTSASVFWGHAEIGFEWLGVATQCVLSNHAHGFHQEMLCCLFLFSIYLSLRNPSNTREPLISRIGSTTSFTFSDPKDRIYGLLGLKTLECDPADGQSFVDPDYNISTMECYRRVAEKLLLQWHNLGVLSRVRHGSKLPEDWPSWVPDWNLNVNTFTVASDQDSIRKRRADLVDVRGTMVGEKHCIEISGFRVDTVDRLVEEYASMGDLIEDHRAPTRLQAMLRSLECAYDRRYLACTFGNWKKGVPLDHVRVANLMREYQAFTSRDFIHNIYINTGITAFNDDAMPSFKPNADRFLRRCRNDKSGRTLFITSSEMLGIGPEAMLPGDTVVVLHGAAIPFVLRPADDGLWRFVGECYLYDVNEGRVHREWKEKGSVSEKFCIY